LSVTYFGSVLYPTPSENSRHAVTYHEADEKYRNFEQYLICLQARKNNSTIIEINKNTPLETVTNLVF